tara:strand:+ start:1676 stop:2374 length:699 start_codon:yes stop_codon:yes gene_type:complete
MTRNNLTRFIKNSQSESVNKIGEYRLTRSVNIFVLETLPENINIQNVISYLRTNVPSYYLNLVDVIYVGHTPEFEERKINAMVKDGALYITSQQSNELDMIDDIVHEVAHLVEERFREEVYGDDEIKDEFLRKRTVLRRVLKYENYVVDDHDFTKIEYDQEFDFFLKDKVGYQKLRIFAQNIFASPYAATSLREYFADGFEDFYLGRKLNLNKISPVLYNKLEDLNNEIQNY